MTLLDFFAFTSSAILIAFALMGWLSFRKRAKTLEKLTKTSTFHCLHCDSVYTFPTGNESGDCPNCGYKNPKLKF